MLSVRGIHWLSFRELLPLALAHAVSLVLISTFQWGQTTKHLLWPELALAGAAWFPSRAYIFYILQPFVSRLTRNDRRVVVAIPLALGLLTLAWWADTISTSP